MLKAISLSLVIVSSLGLSACSKGSPAHNPPVRPHSFQVTRDTFINGATFCSLYNHERGPEFGKWINVPKDYSNPDRGALRIYAYSDQEFNPQLPTVVIVDGGPGQNTHGMKRLFTDQVNEIKFDQRGLGCSTPNTYDEYADPSLYSSDNTTRDMDEIRKAYGLESWAVYGVSYGTQVGTIYGSKFSSHVTSVLLEGVVGLQRLTASASYLTDKWNLILASLTPEQRASVRDLFYETDASGKHASEDNETLWQVFYDNRYDENNLVETTEDLNWIFKKDGTVNRDILARIRSKKLEHAEKYSTAQHPMGVDTNILQIVDCKEFLRRSVPEGNVDYNYNSGFVEADPVKYIKYQSEACDKVNVLPKDEHPYSLTENPISKPVYYFQGSHDGVTLAVGAFEHWKTVPKGPSTFLLAKHGGHNPNLHRLFDSSYGTHDLEQQLLFKAATAQKIESSDVGLVNEKLNDNFDWVLFSNGFTQDAVGYLGGL